MFRGWPPAQATGQWQPGSGRAVAGRCAHVLSGLSSRPGPGPAPARALGRSVLPSTAAACCLEPLFCRLIGPGQPAAQAPLPLCELGSGCSLLSSLGIIFMHNDMTPLTLTRVTDILSTSGLGLSLFTK